MSITVQRKLKTHLRSHVTRLELPGQGLDRWRQQISHRIVELGQVHPDPCPEEDDVAHQGLILKGGSEGAVLTLLDPWPQCLHSSQHVKHKLSSRRSNSNVSCLPTCGRGLKSTENQTPRPEGLRGHKVRGQDGGREGGRGGGERGAEGGEGGGREGSTPVHAVLMMSGREARV